MGVVLLKRKLTSFQIIILGFSGVILFGTFLLMLPFSSRSGLATPFSDALFTSTSAVCVTGLVIHDTATYWSAFGQLVILLLIQIGGMGVITVAASFAMISGRKISLMQRSTMQEAISAPKVGGIVRLTGFIVKVTLATELLCAAVMAPVFCRDFGKIGLWMALFHSVSAFCNAGFDLLGVRTPFSSLTSYAANPVINFTIMFLIVFGGIGFLTWDDIRTNRLHLHKYRMQSKVILCTTAVLLIVPAMYFYFFEFADLTRKERLLSSLFQAVTPRTAGFNTVELTSLSQRHIQRHHDAEADGKEHRSKIRVPPLRHFRDQLLYHHIEHGARREAQKIRQCRDHKLRREKRQHRADGLHRAGEHAAEKCLTLALALRPQRHRDDRSLGEILNGYAKGQHKCAGRRDLRVPREEARIHDTNRHSLRNIM